MKTDRVDIDTLAGQVLGNCHISDATHAGVFSICGLALRMRDLYKWEKQLPPWKEKAEEDILDWIGRREDRWEEVREKVYQPLSVSGVSCDPFDTEGINRTLKPLGFFYGAGYAYSLKPTFFLAGITEEKMVAGKQVYRLGRELARDLLTLPALAQNDHIVLRTDAARMYLWDQIQYLNKSGKPYLQYALKKCGATDSTPAAILTILPQLLEAREETYIHHEIGEITDTLFDRKSWREIIADHPHTPVELLTRSVKDLLADTGPRGSLAHLVASRNRIALSLYAAFHDGLHRKLFPEFRTAFTSFIESENWAALKEAVAAGCKHACRMTRGLIEIHREGKKRYGKAWAGAQIQKRFIDLLK